MEINLFLGILILLAALLGVGVLARADAEVPEFIGEDLDQMLAARESKFDDIVDGAEKKIHWADQANVKTRYAFVYLHGFGATRQETHPVTEQIASEFGGNVYYERLTGHGRNGAAMAATSLDQWKADAREALRIGQLLGERVVLIGTSTGATLATWLVGQQAIQEDIGGIHSLVYISPNFDIADKSAHVLRWPLALSFAEWVGGKERSWEPRNELHAKYWTNSYPLAALLPMLDLITEIKELDLSKVKIPLITVYSAHDTVIDVDEVAVRQQQFGSPHKRLVEYTPNANESNHVIAGDIVAPMGTPVVVAQVTNFLRELEQSDTP